METAYIFIDEFGNSTLNLNKSATFSHFVYASVIISESNIAKAERIRSEICKKFKLGPNIKSSNISEKQFDKRLQILKYLFENLDFIIDVLVIDKHRLESDGLKEKRVFYKYFQTLYVSKYNKRFQSYFIKADEVGEDFKIELQSYINKHGIQRDLFNTNRFFQLLNDKEEKLIQLADFIVGCLGKIFCTSHANNRSKEIYDIIHTRLTVDYFPYPSINKSVSHNELDNEIMVLNNNIVNTFYENNLSESNTPTIILLKYLSLQCQIADSRFVPTIELLTYLQLFFPDFTKEKLRLIIRDLRYEGLFIVSHSGKSGYKFATSYDDIAEHFNHFLKHVLPMLEKVNIINERLSHNSFNKINLLEKDPALKKMKDLVSTIK